MFLMALDRTALLDTAARVLAEDNAASMQQVAAAAGISRTTLHRAFATREALVEAVTERVLDECARHFDAAGIDAAPVLEAFDRIADTVVPLALAHAILFTEPSVYRVERFAAAVAAQEERFERYFVRGQADGVFRADLPPRWLVFSVGSQFAALWYAIHEGFIGAREAPRLLRTTVLGGVLAEAPR